MDPFVLLHGSSDSNASRAVGTGGAPRTQSGAVALQALKAQRRRPYRTTATTRKTPCPRFSGNSPHIMMPDTRTLDLPRLLPSKCAPSKLTWVPRTEKKLQADDVLYTVTSKPTMTKSKSQSLYRHADNDKASKPDTTKPTMTKAKAFQRPIPLAQAEGR